MRTLRLSLVGMVILALLGGMGGAVLAQESEAETTEPTGVVVTLSDWASASDGIWSNEPGVAYAAGQGIVHTYTWEATDPRLSGAATYSGTWHAYEPLETVLEAFEWQVVNDQGSWSGTGYSIGSADAIYGDAASVVLAGDRAYEGLTAYLSFDLPEGDTARGLIVADEMPPFPEPAE